MTSWSKEFYVMVLVFIFSAMLPYSGMNINTTLKIQLMLIFCVCVFVIYISVNHSFNASKIADSAISESPDSLASDSSSRSSRYELPEITSLLSPLSGTEEGILHTLSLIGELTDCTRCSVYEVQGSLKIAKRKFFWIRGGADEGKDILHNSNMKMFPWIFSTINNKKSIYVRDISSVKEEAPDIKLLQTQVKNSFVVMPLLDEKDIFGFIFIEDSQKIVSLEEEPYDLIFLSEILRLAVVQKKFLDEISLFKNLINRSNDYIIVIDRNTSKVIDVNETFCTHAGYSKAEFISMESESLMDIVGNFWTGAFFETCGSNYLDVDSSFKTKNGTKIPVEINVTFIAHDESEYVLAVARNIVERKEREMMLQKTRDRVELALNGADLGMWDWDVATDELIFNARWAEMLGYKATNFPSNFKAIAKMIHEQERDKVLSVFRSIKQQSPFFEEEFRINTINNETKWLLVRGKATEFDLEGKVSRLTGTAMDISERKLSEDHLKQYADKLQRSNEMKELFTDILRHDLLNPAGAIKGYTELLLEIENNERKKTMLERIQNSDEKLIDMIDTAAKFAKLESQDELEFSIMDIGYLLRSAIENLRPMFESKKMEVVMRFSGAHNSSVNPIVEEVFANFLTNAVKYSSENTSIFIDIFDDSGMWKVAVSDQGEGIADADKPYVFDRFKRVTKKGVKGTGLGLAIVKRIAELHKGDVGVENNPDGKGSRFWIMLKKA